MATDENLLIQVDYYDEAEKIKFENSRSSNEIGKIAGTTLTVSKAEFLTYLLFPVYKYGTSLYTYETIKSKVPMWVSATDELLDFSHGTVNWKLPNPDMTSRVGVAVGLCVANSIHKTTEADWCRIPEIVGRTHAKKTLDYRLQVPDSTCSTGEYFVHMEAKGSAPIEGTRKTSSISKHKQDIINKKLVQRPEDNKDVYYGTIAVVDQESTAKCLLVDPPSPERLLDPKRHKLLSRLEYFWSQLYLVSPNSSLTTVLRNRIRDVSALNAYDELDFLHLVNRNGEKTSMYPSFFTSRSGIRSMEVVGRLFPFDENKLLFVGTVPEIYDLVINQDFEDILAYKYASHSTFHRLTCVVRKTERGLYSHVLRSPVGNIIQGRERTSRQPETIQFDLHGQFHFSSSGRVFGVVSLDESHLEHQSRVRLF